MRALKKVMKIVKVKTLLKIRKNLLPKNLKTTKFRMRRDTNPDWKENDKKGLFYSNMNGCIFGGELKANVLHYPPDKDQKAKIVRGMLQHLKIPKKDAKLDNLVSH